MSHPILERHLESRSLKPLYLFYGEEEFLMDRAVKRLETFLAGDLGEAPLRIVQESQEIDLEDFLAQARMPPLWGSGQLLVLRRVEAYPAKALQALLPYLAHPARRSWLVLTAPSLKAKEVEKHPIFSRLLKEHAALAFWRRREEELYPWLMQEAKRLGKSLTPAAARRLVEVVGDNLAELSQELEKVALLAGEENTLAPHLVEQLASHSRSYNIFALVDALGEAQPHKRLTALAHLLEMGEPPPLILSMLARQVRLLIHLKEATPGSPPETLTGKLKLPGGVLKRLAQQARAFRLSALRAHLLLLQRVDYQLKTSAANPRLWLEWALLQMGPG